MVQEDVVVKMAGRDNVIFLYIALPHGKVNEYRLSKSVYSKSLIKAVSRGLNRLYLTIYYNNNYISEASV